jgi:DME family drug/metabolite transporter
MPVVARPRSTPSRSTPSASRATLALVVASVLWGTTGTAASFFPTVVSPLAIGACTMLVGGLLLFLVSARPSLAALRSGPLLGWMVVGAAGVVVYPLAFYSGMNLAGVAIGNVVALGSGPVFAAALEWAWERRRLGTRGLVSTAMAVVGVAALGLFGHSDVGARGGTVLPGVALGLLAGFAYALYTYSSTRAIGLGGSGRAVMGATFGLGAIGLVPVLLATGAPLAASAHSISIAAYLAIGPMFVAYLFFGSALGRLRSSAVTTITLLEPVVATFLAVFVVGERLAGVGWAAIGLILAGVVVLATGRSPGDGPRQAGDPGPI